MTVRASIAQLVAPLPLSALAEPSPLCGRPLCVTPQGQIRKAKAWTLETKVWPYVEDTLRKADQTQYKIIAVNKYGKPSANKLT